MAAGPALSNLQHRIDYLTGIVSTVTEYGAKV
jgi:hypothetical protein